MIVADGKEDASVEGRQAAPSLRLCVGGGGEGRYTGLFACSLDVVASSFGSAGSGGPFSFGLGFGVDEGGGGSRGGEESLVSVTLAAGGMERRGPTESLGRVVA